jgi:hypothetical protein
MAGSAVGRTVSCKPICNLILIQQKPRQLTLLGPQPLRHYMRSDILTAVKTSMLVFWVVAHCRLTSRYQTFGGTHNLHILPEDGSNIFLRNVGIYLEVRTALIPRTPTWTVRYF